MTWTHRGRRTELALEVACTPREAWEAWADPAAISRWFTDAAEGAPEVGSTITWIFQQFGARVPYTVVAAGPGRRYALGFPASGEPSGFLELEFSPAGAGTRIALVNSGLPDIPDNEEMFLGIESGWRAALAILKLHLERYAGRSKQMVLSTRAAEFEYAAAHRLFADPALRAQWLTVPASELGEVLADSGREIVLAWPAVEGTLELKAFGNAPDARILGLRGLSWSAAPAALAGAAERFEQSLDQLEKLLVSST